MAWGGRGVGAGKLRGFEPSGPPNSGKREESEEEAGFKHPGLDLSIQGWI